MANNNRDDQNSDNRDEPIVAVPLPLSNTGSGFMPAIVPIVGLVDQANADHADADGGIHINRMVGGYNSSDDRLNEEINDHLTQHGYIDASEILVTVKDGDVTLEGSVPDEDQKKYAEEVAQKVSGVTHVHNQLNIKKSQNPLVQNTAGKQ